MNPDKSANHPEIPNRITGAQDVPAAHNDADDEVEATYKPLTMEDIRAANKHKREPITEYILPIG